MLELGWFRASIANRAAKSLFFTMPQVSEGFGPEATLTPLGRLGNWNFREASKMPPRRPLRRFGEGVENIMKME
jgi:hypothetical protein